MSKKKEKNVFISHYKKDEKFIELFKKNLKKHGYTVNNYSIDSSKENRASDKSYIKQMLREQIKPAPTLICLIGHKTHEREFVDFEIKCAWNKDKRIIGVYLPGKEHAELPDSLEKHANAIVNWDFPKIIKAINGTNTFCNPDGTERAKNSKHSITRVVC